MWVPRQSSIFLFLKLALITTLHVFKPPPLLRASETRLNLVLDYVLRASVNCFLPHMGLKPLSVLCLFLSTSGKYILRSSCLSMHCSLRKEFVT